MLRPIRLRTQASTRGCPGVYRAAVSRAAAGLLAALLMAGCAELSAIRTDTYGIKTQLSELKRDQDAGFKKMEFSLAKQQESLDSQRDALTSLREDIEKQLAELRRDLRGGAASAESSGVPVTPGPGVVAPPPSGTGPVSPGPVVSPPPVAPPTPVAPPPPPTEEQLLQTAEEQVAARNYQKAVELYTAYLQDHAASARAPEAMLRLGKCYYEMKDLPKARQTFNDVIEKHPSSAVVPVAYHSRAVCELVQNDLKAAKATLDQLQKVYPDHEREQIAKLRKNYFPQ